MSRNTSDTSCDQNFETMRVKIKRPCQNFFRRMVMLGKLPIHAGRFWFHKAALNPLTIRIPILDVFQKSGLRPEPVFGSRAKNRLIKLLMRGPAQSNGHPSISTFHWPWVPFGHAHLTLFAGEGFHCLCQVCLELCGRTDSVVLRAFICGLHPPQMDIRWLYLSQISAGSAHFASL